MPFGRPHATGGRSRIGRPQIRRIIMSCRLVPHIARFVAVVLAAGVLFAPAEIAAEAMNIREREAGSAPGDTNYVITTTEGSADDDARTTHTLTIEPVIASVALSNLDFVYDGTSKVPAVATAPAEMDVQLTYDGSLVPPVQAGMYRVEAAVVDPDSVGSVSGTLIIRKATPEVVWNGPAPISYGMPLGADQLNASANTAGTFSYLPEPGTILPAGPNQVLTVVFTPDDMANFNRVTAATTITVDKAASVVALADLAQQYDGTPRTVRATTTPADLRVDITYGGSPSAPIFPGRYAVAATVDDPNFTGIAVDTLTVDVTALVRRVPRLNGGIDGSMQVLSGESIAFNRGAWLSGDLLVPGRPKLQLSGLPMLAGAYDEDGAASPANYTVTLSGTSVIRYLVRQIDPIELPRVNAPAAPEGTRDVVARTVGQDLGTMDTIRHLTVVGAAGEIALPAGTYGRLMVSGDNGLVLGRTGEARPEVYNLQGLAVTGGAEVRLVGPVLLVIGGDVALDGVLGDEDHPEWLTVAVAAGNVALAPNATLAGAVIAPGGTVTIGGGAMLLGKVMSDGLAIQSGGVLVESQR